MEHFCPSWCKYFRLCFAFNKALLCSDNKFVTILTTFDSRCIHYNNRTKNNSGKLTRAPIMRNSHFVLIYNCLAYEETVEVLTQTVWRRNSESEMEKQSWTLENLNHLQTSKKLVKSLLNVHIFFVNYNLCKFAHLQRFCNSIKSL